MSYNVAELIGILNDYPDDMEVMLLGWEWRDSKDSHKAIYEVYDATIDYQDIDDDNLVDKKQDVVLIV